MDRLIRCSKWCWSSRNARHFSTVRPFTATAKGYIDQALLHQTES